MSKGKNECRRGWIWSLMQIRIISIEDEVASWRGGRGAALINFFDIDVRVRASKGMHTSRRRAQCAGNFRDWRTTAFSHPLDTALALKLVTARTTLLRLKTIARKDRTRTAALTSDGTTCCREAFTRMITGQRARPEGVGTKSRFLAGVMRSLRTDHLRRTRHGTPLPLRFGSNSRHEARDLELRDPRSGPEDWLIAQQELIATGM